MAVDQPELLRSVASVMLALSWAFVILRVYVRTWMVKAFGADDWLAVASLLIFTLHCAFVFVGLSYLSGSANPELALLDEIEALKWWYAASLPYIAGTALIKGTVGVFLLRFCGSNLHRHIIYAVLAVVTLYDIAYLIICIFQCLPVGHFWLQYTGQRGTCISRNILTWLSYTASGLNAAGDIILGTLPILLVRKLQMGYRTKVSVACILALGSISCISTVVRLPYLVTLLTTTDFLTATTPVAIWGLVELGLGLIAASMVTLKPLFKTWFTGERSYFGPSQASKSNTYPSHSRHRSNFIELGEQKAGRARAPTESEEALALDDLPLSERETQYGRVVKKADGVMAVTISSTRQF